MNKKILIGSIIAVVILVLVSFTGVVGYHTTKSSTISKPEIHISELEKEPLIKYSVIEYKSDGTIEKTFVEIPLHQAEILRNELKKSTSLADKYSIYQNHGFIPKDVTLDQLRAGMEEKSQLLGLSEENLQTINSSTIAKMPIFNTVIKNLKCSVWGDIVAGFRGILGLSSFTRIINWLIYTLIQKESFVPSLDLIIIQGGLGGLISTENGELPDTSFLGILVVFILIGFVGYYVTINLNALTFLPLISLPGLLVEDFFIGYATYIVAAAWDALLPF